MKRKMFFRLTVVCLIAVSALIACTKDYGSDIKELQDKVAGLSQQVADLDKLIKDGCVITAVTPVENGTKVTLSNGKEFTITNGEDGNDGKDGTVWKIENGTWWYDNGDGFKDSGKPSQGPKGDPGNDGKSAYELSGFNGTEAEWIASLQGKDGKSAYELSGFNGTEAEWIASLQGKDGKDGDYYYPCVDKDSANYKHWIKVNGETGEETVQDALWLSDDVVTAVWDESTQTLTLHNVDGADEGVVEISLALGLSSLAIIPELWDANLGMPTAEVYAMLPSAWEICNVLMGKDGNNLFRYKAPGVLYGAYNGSNPYADSRVTTGDWGMWFWNILWNSYCGKNGLTNAAGYNAAFDMTNPDFTYNWVVYYINKANAENTYEFTLENFVDMVDKYLGYFEAAFDNVTKYNPYYVRQFPVSDLNVKYRINPAGADLSEYQFHMIDRTLNITTKAEGDHRDHAAVVGSAVKNPNFKDQLDVTAYINYFKYFADKPLEWMLSMLSIKERYVAQYEFLTEDDFTKDAARPEYGPAWITSRMLYRLWPNDVVASSGATNALVSMSQYMTYNKLSHDVILALEAAKNENGAEAIVSDYMNVKLQYVLPLWTAFNHHDTDRSVERWMLTPNYTNNYKAQGGGWYENDYLKIGETYDVAAHMRFADPYYGRVENLGFDVVYDYYVFCADHNEAPNNYEWYDGGNGGFGDLDGDIYGETEDNRFAGWDKVNCTSDGKVSVKEDAKGSVGQYVMITADASIKNHATNTVYNSAVSGNAVHPWGESNKMFDEMSGHYILKIIPSDDVENVEHFIGSFDYLTLPASGKAPASKLLEALDMDFTGFNAVYTANPTVTTESGVAGDYTWTFQRADDMFIINLTNQVDLGDGFITFHFQPNDGNYKQICYTVKWNVYIDWTKTEPILNEDYILYEMDEDGNSTDVLAKTDIVPDPVEAYPTARPEGDFPYVDSIVTVKGKEVDGVWKPQSSIKEHIHEYGSYLAAQPNIDNMAMEINWTNSQKTDGAEIFLADAGLGTSYKNQEIKLTKPFAEGEMSRDYVVDIKITLANGTSKIVKAYIVRFVCPFYIVIGDDLELYTHTMDWCSDWAGFEIREVGTDKLLVFWSPSMSEPGTMKQRVTRYAQDTYGTDVFSSGSLNAPKWTSLADATFGERLLYEENTGWFYWNNLGTDLQQDKWTTYKVTQEITGLATLKGEGKIHIHKTKESPAAHSDEGNGPEVEPGDNAHATWEVEFE